MKVIFAQGNPGTQFVGTRHNIGFFIVDTFARNHRASWNEKSKFHAEVAELTIDSEKVLLVKPVTFYNETGQSARAIVDFYKLDPTEDIFVIHDELALPFGKLRTRSGGSDAGNNGIKSLNGALGQDYKRLRIGIYNDLRDRVNDIDFVVGKFTRAEADQLPHIYAVAEPSIRAFLAGAHLDETVTIDTPPVVA